MMNKILALPQAISQKAVNVLNGKLTVPQTTGLRFIHLQLETLTRQFEDLESHLTSVNLQEREGYVKQLDGIEVSVQRLEKLYHRLLSTTMIATVTLALLGFGIISSRQSVANQSTQKTTVAPSVERHLSNH
jgi:hypothetical protein